MLVIALTGGIGSGKSAVSEAFARHGIPVIDTDLIARELVRPGQQALREIVREFGPACLDASGKLDRTHLRRVVFADPALRERLEAILHPRIRRAVQDRLAAIDAPYCLVVIPLLVESGMNDLAQRVLVVDVPEAVQIARVMARDGADEEQARRILAAQASRARRLETADDVLDNNGDLSSLEAAVSALHEKYLNLASDRPARPMS